MQPHPTHNKSAQQTQQNDSLLQVSGKRPNNKTLKKDQDLAGQSLRAGFWILTGRSS